MQAFKYEGSLESIPGWLIQPIEDRKVYKNAYGDLCISNYTHMKLPMIARKNDYVLLLEDKALIVPCVPELIDYLDIKGESYEI